MTDRDVVKMATSFMIASEVALHVAQNAKDMYQVRARYCESAYVFRFI